MKRYWFCVLVFKLLGLRRGVFILSVSGSLFKGAIFLGLVCEMGLVFGVSVF